MHKEKRKHARLALHAKTIFKLEDQSVEGESENFFMKGAFVRTVRQMDINDFLYLQYFRPRKSEGGRGDEHRNRTTV